MSMRLAGVDGCRGGWAVAFIDLAAARPRVEFYLCETFPAVSDLLGDGVAAVDMPIGLLDQPQSGGRSCDQEARRLLPGKTSSVFSPPTRIILNAESYSETQNFGLTIQAFNLLPKVRELDAWMTPERQGRVVESHPELAFCQHYGRPIQESKKASKGIQLRKRVLREANVGWFRYITARLKYLQKQYPRSQVAIDDWIDACVLLITAQRIANGSAIRLPRGSEIDSQGLRMEIWA